MSRSRKKNRFCKIAGNTDKISKRKANRIFRRVNKIRLNNAISLEDVMFAPMREITNVWSFNSDGLAHYIHDTDWRGNPFTPEELNRFMRK